MRAQLEAAYGPSAYAQLYGGADGAANRSQAGFVITIEGYSPYRRIGDLLDPPNVKDNPKLWGFVNAAGAPQGVPALDVNSPFEIYPTDKGIANKNPPNFKLETGAVDLDTEIPKGVGEWLFIPDPPAPGRYPYGGDVRRRHVPAERDVDPHRSLDQGEYQRRSPKGSRDGQHHLRRHEQTAEGHPRQLVQAAIQADVERGRRRSRCPPVRPPGPARPKKSVAARARSVTIKPQANRGR